MKFAHEQLLEFKSRIMESQAALQKDLQKVEDNVLLRGFGEKSTH